MSTVEELEKQIQDLQKELELKKQKESFKFPVGYHDTYYFLTAFGEIKEGFWIGSIRDENKSYQGNVFKTKQEAEKERDRRILLTKFRQFRDKCNGAWKPDWEDKSEDKFCVLFNHESGELVLNLYVYVQPFESFGCFKNTEDAKHAIELFGDEIKRLFGGIEMSSVQELEEKVKELMKEIEKLKQAKKNEEFEYPFEDKEEYWSVGVKGGINHLPWTGIEFDTKRYEQGHIFKTEQEAIRERDKRALLTRFRQFRDKCNGEWKPEWINHQERKYFIGYLAESKSYTATSCTKGDLFILFGYFKNEDDCKRAIELFGDEIKRLYVEELK